MEVGTRTPSTPPRSSNGIRTPPAPMHGYSDDWEPYSPRKSARISQRTVGNRTPSPGASSRQASTNNDHKNLASPKKSGRMSRTSTMASPASPQKKRAPAMGSTRGLLGNITSESTASASAALFQPGVSSISAAAGNGMLITPAKTPQKAPTEETRKKIQAVARTLFDSEVMPSPKKAQNNYVLDSFDEEADIPIYTDSHERIPEVDQSLENPFYSTGSSPPPSAPRRSKRQTVSIPGEGKISVEEAVKRNDGVLVVFRGKKHFRKFATREVDESNSQGLGEIETTHRERQPLTRSSVKPRLLFPSKPKAPKTAHTSHEDEDEEALTDIEDHVMAEETENKPATPMELVEEVPGTPVAPKFAPASPPSTTRTTRFGAKKAAEPSPKAKSSKSPKRAKSAELDPQNGKTGSGKRSPFDIWGRSKTPTVVQAAPSQSQKRQGEEMGSESVKRSRA